MTNPRGLIGLGLPVQLAKRLGIDPGSGAGNPLASTGTSQATAQAIGQFSFYVRANAQSSAYAYIMPSNAEVGSEYTFVNTGAVTAVLWPPVNGQFNINAGATATGLSLALAKGLFLVAVTASTFDVLLSS